MASGWPYAVLPPLRLGYRRACDPLGYGHEPLVCERCGGEMKIIAFIIDHQVIDKILRHLSAKGYHRQRGPTECADLEAAS